MSSNPFEYVSAINAGKDIIRNSDNPELMERGYVAYMVNNALSYHAECTFFANQMNIYHNLPPKMQNDYYLNTLRPRKRFSKWAKVDRNDDLKVICEYYGCNMQVAKSYHELLSPAQLKLIKKQQEHGGIKNGKSGRSKSEKS